MPTLVFESDAQTEKPTNGSCSLRFLKLFLKKLDQFEQNSSVSVGILKPFFKNPLCKRHLLKQVDPKDYIKFQTLWEGVKNLLKTIEKEKDFKAIKADQRLLDEDLKKMKTFVQSQGLF